MQKEENKISGIYCIENKINYKKYIGQSINVYSRWNKHKSELNHGNHDNDYLQKSWNKYGEENFEFYILEECSKDTLDDKEIYWIKKYNSLNKDFGYNLKEGGQNGSITDDAKDKLSKSLKKYYESNEVLERKRQQALEQWSNPDIKDKITGVNNGMYGKTHTEEARQKISQKAKGRISPNRNTTSVLCVELNKIYTCAIEAANELGLQSGRILQACRGDVKSHGKYHWKFMENNI